MQSPPQAVAPDEQQGYPEVKHLLLCVSPGYFIGITKIPALQSRWKTLTFRCNRCSRHHNISRPDSRPRLTEYSQFHTLGTVTRSTGRLHRCIYLTS